MKNQQIFCSFLINGKFENKICYKKEEQHAELYLIYFKGESKFPFWPQMIRINYDPVNIDFEQEKQSVFGHWINTTRIISRDSTQLSVSCYRLHWLDPKNFMTVSVDLLFPINAKQHSFPFYSNFELKNYVLVL